MWMSHPNLPGVVKTVADSAFYGGWDTLGWVVAAEPAYPAPPDQGWPISKGELTLALAAAGTGGITAAQVDTKIATDRADQTAQDSSTFVPLLTPVETITYNPDGTVASQTIGGIPTTYTYNGDGTVATETRSGVTRTYTYTGLNLTAVA